MIFLIYAEDNKILFNLRWARILLVCKHWYNVALRTPELWSYIEIRGFAMPEVFGPVIAGEDLERRRFGVQTMRAGQWPITLKIFIIVSLSPTQKAHLVTLCDLCSSLRSLTVYGNRTTLRAGI